MSQPTVTHVRQGFPILGLLGILFVGLKLTGYIDWSWWWVTTPFWGPFALVAAFFLFGVICWLTVAMIGGILFMAGSRRKERR